MKSFDVDLRDAEAYDKLKYPAGEMQVRLKPATLEALVDADKIRITARVKSAEDLVEIAMLCSALRSRPASTPIELLLPYLPYARADRRFVDGDCFGLEVFASLVNSLKVSVTTIDAHSFKSKELIERLTDLPAERAMNQVIQDLEKSGTPVTLLFPDDGARKRYAHLSLRDDLQILNCAKVRDKKTGKLSGFSVPTKADFKSSCVLLVDDICDGGGTFTGIGDALQEYGLDLNLYVTHGIFSKGLDPLLKHFNRIFTTDSFDSRVESSRLTRLPVAEFF